MVVQPRPIATYVLVVALLAITVAGASARGDEWQDRLFGMGQPDTFTLTSELLERDFHIYVRLPEGYEDSDEQWPVIYLLDGGILFPMLAPYHFMLTIDGVGGRAPCVRGTGGIQGRSSLAFRQMKDH